MKKNLNLPSLPVFAEYVFYASLVSVIISQSLLDLLSTVFLVSALYLAYKEKRLKEVFKSIGVEIPIVLYFFAVLVSLLNSPTGFEINKLLLLFKFKWVVFLYVTHNFFRIYSLNYARCLNSVLLSSLIPSLYGILTFVLGREFIHTDRVDINKRIVGLVNSPTYHAHGTTLLFVFTGFLAFSYYARKRTFNFALLLPLTLLFVNVYLTYTRGALLALGTSLVVGLWQISRKGAVLFTISGIIMLSVVSTIDQNLYQRITDSKPQNLDQDRVGLFKNHLYLFKENIVTGFGYDQYKDNEFVIKMAETFRVAPYLRDSHAHNQYLQVMSGTGLFGLIAFMGILLAFGRKIYLVSKNSLSDKNFYAVPVGICILLLFITDQTFEYAKLRYLIVALITICILRSSDTGKNNE